MSLSVVEWKDVMSPCDGSLCLVLMGTTSSRGRSFRLLGTSTHGEIIDVVPLLLAGQLMSYNRREYAWRQVSERECIIKVVNRKAL